MSAAKRALTLPKPAVFAGIRHVVHLLRAMRNAVAGRRALARMDERMLADIGMSQSEAAYEMNRKPWDTAPSRPERRP